MYCTLIIVTIILNTPVRKSLNGSAESSERGSRRDPGTGEEAIIGKVTAVKIVEPSPVVQAGGTSVDIDNGCRDKGTLYCNVDL